MVSRIWRNPPPRTQTNIFSYSHRGHLIFCFNFISFKTNLRLTLLAALRREQVCSDDNHRFTHRALCSLFGIPLISVKWKLSSCFVFKLVYGCCNSDYFYRLLIYFRRGGTRRRMLQWSKEVQRRILLHSIRLKSIYLAKHTFSSILNFYREAVCFQGQKSQLI